MRPELEAAGVRIVTVSTDKPAEIRAGHRLHGLQATLLADPRLAITDRFGLRNRAYNNFRLPGRPGLPVPTTLLVDEQGRVVWMDQSDNYTRRSDPAVVRQALARFAVTSPNP